MTDQLKSLINQPKYRSQSFIIKVLLNVCISCAMFGYTNAHFSTIDYQDFTRIFQITQYKAFLQGFITGQCYLTAALGGFVASYLLRKFSRTHCFLIVNAFYSVTLMGVMFRNIYSLIFFRLIQGLLAGIYSSMAPIYVKEFSPLQLSSKTGTFYQMSNVFGLALSFFVTYVCSLLFQPEVYWRIVFGFPIVLIAFQSYMLIYKYNYETPKYLLSIQSNQEAKKLLHIIYKEDYVQERVVELKKMFSLSSNKNIELKQITKRYEDDNIKTTEDQKGQNQSKQNKKHIEYHNNKLAIYAAIHISTLQQFSGISIVLGYGAQIVKRVFPSLSKILPIFLHLQAVFACLIAIQLLKSQGRKTLAQYGCLFCGICTFYLGYRFAELGGEQIGISTGFMVLLSLFTYRFIYGITLGPVAFLYIPEIIEPNVMPYVIVLYWFSAFLTVMIFPLVKKYIFDGNPGPIFMIFAVYTLLSMIINQYALVETKGKKQYEIRIQYDKKLGINHDQNTQQSQFKIETKRLSIQK